jgi:hypothetical protein
MSAFDDAFEWLMSTTYTAMPATVVKYDFANQMVDVKPDIDAVGQEGELQPRPTIAGIPICFPCSPTSAITFPLPVGSKVLVVWSMRGTDNWKQNGSSIPPDYRMNDIRDGFAIPAPYPMNQAKTKYGQSPDDLVLIHNLGGNQTELHLKASGDIVANTPTKFQINCNQLEINAASTQINSPVTTNSSVIATGDVVGAGISLSKHVHGGVAVGGSNTSGPQ